MLGEARGIAELVLAPLVADVSVLQPSIETATGSMIGPGDLVIAMGVDPTSPDAVELVEAAAEAGAPAVVFRMPRGTEIASLRQAAEAGGVGLIRIPPELGWDQAYSALESAVSAAALGLPAPDGARVRPGDLNSLANAVAAMAGGPVTIEDPDSQVLAHSSGAEPLDEPRRASILERRTPEQWRQRFEAAGVYHRLWTSDDVIRIDEFVSEGLRSRLAVAIRVGDELLGSIWVAEGAHPLGAESETAMSEAARIAAVHLARRRSTAHVERRVRGDLLRSLLEGRGAPDILAQRLGLPTSGPYAVLAFRVRGPDEIDHPVARDRVVGLVGLGVEAWASGSVTAAVGDTIYALVPLGDDDPKRRNDLIAAARELVARARSALGVRILGGMAEPVASLDAVPAARAEASSVLAALAGSARDFCTSADVRAAIILDELRAGLGDDYAAPSLLEDVARHDAESGTDYLTTLRTYLETFGDATKAAARLGIHPNTFRYRIRRLDELFGLDLDDPEERLAVEFQLTLT